MRQQWQPLDGQAPSQACALMAMSVPLFCTCLAYVCQILTPHATVTGHLFVMVLVVIIIMIVGLRSKALRASQGVHIQQ